MERCTLQQRIEIVKILYKNGENFSFIGIRHFANDSISDFMATIGRYGCGRCLFPTRRR